MSTNYFAPPTIAPPRVIENPAAEIRIPTIAPGATSGEFGAIPQGANAPARAEQIRLLGTGEGSIYDTYMKLIRAKRTETSGALSGYGGIAFKPSDDLSTVGRDESLEIQYETGRVGERERSEYDKALFQSLASGGVGRAQLIGAALQRVSKEAQDIISQYSRSITNAEGTGYADIMGVKQGEALAKWAELYGADAAQYVKDQMKDIPIATPPTGPNNAAPHDIVAGGGQVSPQNDFVKGKTVYNGSGKPNTKAYRDRFKASDGYIVQEFPPDRKGGNYRVVVTFLYNPASPASPGVNAGLMRPPAGSPGRPVVSPPRAPAKPPAKPPGRGGRR